MSLTTKQFIDKVKIGAIEGRKQHGILSSVSIAQAACESGWGTSTKGNNLFGIKANGWKGKTIVITTHEYIKGVYTQIKDTFRSYNSWNDSISDHAAFLVQNERYKNIVNNKNYIEVCHDLQKDGYSTSPTYAITLIGIIQKYGLTRFDK